MNQNREGSSRIATRLLTVLAGTSLPLLGSQGCENTKKTVIAEPPPAAFQAPAPYDGSGRPVTEQIGGRTRALAGGPTLIAQQRLTANLDRHEGVAPTAINGQQPGEMIPVTIDLRTADISDALRILLRDYLKRDFVLDPKITGQVTLQIDDEFSRSDLMDLVSGLTSVYGWFLEEREGVIFVRAGDRMPKTPQAPILLAPPALESDQPAVRVRRLRYVAGDQIASLLKELMAENAKAIVVGRTVVLADTTRQITRLSKLLTALDTPGFDGVEIWTYRLSSQRPEDVQKVLESLATGAGMGAANDSQVAFVTVPGTQRLMVVAKDASLQPMMQELLRQVDQPADSKIRQAYSYRVQHYPLAQLQKLLTDFFGDRIEAQAGAPANAPPGADPTAPRVRIASDPQSDLLLILATPADYIDLLATLEVIDRPPQQVVIESIIAEVRLTNRLEYGVEYFLESQTKLGLLELVGNAPLTNAALATGGAFFIGGSGFAVIQALDRESGARVLSHPKITITDRTKASIQVGGEVPTIKASEGSQTQEQGTSGIREEIEYRKTGVILTLEPLISENGLVTIKIKQEVAAALPTQVVNQPEFTTRNIDTTVVVPSGMTVLLGGIINQDNRDEGTYIPLIGRVPIVGAAFSRQQKSSERTELLLALTPTIINEPAHAAPVYSEFLQSIDGVRTALLERPSEMPRGSLHDQLSPMPENPVPAQPEAPVDPLAPESTS